MRKEKGREGREGENREQRTENRGREERERREGQKRGTEERERKEGSQLVGVSESVGEWVAGVRVSHTWTCTRAQCILLQRS